MDSLLRITQTCHGMSYRLNRHIFILDFNEGDSDLGMNFNAVQIKYNSLVLECTRTSF